MNSNAGKIYFVIPNTANGIGGAFAFAYTKKEAREIAMRYVRFGHSACVYEASDEPKEFLTENDRKIVREIKRVNRLISEGENQCESQCQ